MAEDLARWIVRNPAGTALIVFAHGFSGDALATWDNFPELLGQDPDILAYDLCFWGYPSSLNPLTIIKRLVWSDNPDLDTLSRGLRSLLDNTAGQYKKLILVGHSM